MYGATYGLMSNQFRRDHNAAVTAMAATVTGTATAKIVTTNKPGAKIATSATMATMAKIAAKPEGR